MKQVLGIVLGIIALVCFMILTRDACNYTRVARVCADSNGEQYLHDAYGELWEVLDELPVGAEVEITLREGGVLGECFDDIIVNVEVLSEPAETERVFETVVAPLDID